MVFSGPSMKEPPIATPVSAPRGRRLVRAALVGAWLAAVGCGPSEEGRVHVKHEDPAVHVLRVASVWREIVEDEGIPAGEPEITFFRIRTEVRVELGAGGAVREAIDRTELFRMRDGFEYHCLTRGVLPATARYEAIAGEIHVTISNVAARLPRECREPAFAKKSKDLPAGSTVFALRSDRLVAIEPARARTVLLPVQ